MTEEKDTTVEEKPVSKIQATAEKKPEEFVLTDELRKQALEKPVFKILYVGDGDSRLAPFRGETMLKTFSTFYERQADIQYYTVTSAKFANMNIDDLVDVNIIWMDNVSTFAAAKNLADIQGDLMEDIEPGWKDKFKELDEKDKEAALKYATEINKKRNDKLKIVYALDEFIWEGPIGRSHDVQTVQLMETAMNIADTIVVPNPELREAIIYFKFTQDPDKDVYVIPSSVSIDFFPLYKNFTKTGKAELSQLRDKPKVLIKGLTIPKNVEEFIVNNYKKMDITISSVDEVNDHVRGLLSRQKISHIYHWANPYVHRGNINATYAIERDTCFDFVIHTKPDTLQGNMYEITTGDEDILFSISYGALPICGVDDMGYDKESRHLAVASGVTFGKDTSSKKLAKIIEKYQTPVMFNEVFNKCRQMVENRISTSPLVIARYFAVMLGKDMSQARAAIAREKKKEIEDNEQKIKEQSEKTEVKQEVKQAVVTDDVPDNVIEADFKKEA